MKLKNLNQQVVVIQGASSGIGRISAKMIAAKGAKVVVSARGEKGLQSLVSEIRGEGGIAEYYVADVTDINQIQSLAKFTEEKFGKIDSWISTAGSWVTAKFEDHTPEEFQRVIDVNLVGMAKTLWTALTHIKRNIQTGAEGGSIILVSSMLGQMPLPYSSSYNASKFGMQGMINALRIELLQDNTPVNLVNVMPFSTNTPIYNTGLSKIGSVPKPAGPITQPELIAQLIVYATENPSRDLYGSLHAFMFDKAYQLVPELVDKVLAKASTKEGQSTTKNRPADAPNNLFSVVEDFRIHGDYSEEAVTEDLFVDYQTQKGASDTDEDIVKQFEPVFRMLQQELTKSTPAGAALLRKATLSYAKLLSGLA